LGSLFRLSVCVSVRKHRTHSRIYLHHLIDQRPRLVITKTSRKYPRAFFPAGVVM